MNPSEKRRHPNLSFGAISHASHTDDDSSMTENSSLSSRVTTWSSLPKTRAGAQRSRLRPWSETAGLPRRQGTSFQASLRPYREVGPRTTSAYKSQHQSFGDNESTRSDVEDGNCCLNTCGYIAVALTPSTSTRRMLFSLILASILCVFVTLHGPLKAEMERHRLDSKAAEAHMHFTPLMSEITTTMDTPAHSAYDFSKGSSTSSSKEKITKMKKSPRQIDGEEDNTDSDKDDIRDPHLSILNKNWDFQQKSQQNEQGNGESREKEDDKSATDETKAVEQMSQIPPQQVSGKSVVAYVLPVFSCYPRNSNGISDGDPVNDDEFHDAAFMLQASVHDNSARNPNSKSAYDYQMVAIIHMFVQVCQVGGANRTKMLLDMGYRVHVVREPIHQVDVRDVHLKRHAPHNNGPMVGMKEMIRLYAFTLEEYPIVTLIDFLTWMAHPPDAVYDVLLNGPHSHHFLETHPDHVVLETFYPNGTIIPTTELPTEIDVIFARNYASLGKNQWSANINLSFLPLRPSKQIFKTLIATYQSTHYDEKWGWDHKGYAGFPGSMTTLGLLTFYYNEIRPDRRLEVDHCIYNNMASVPYVALQRGTTNQCRDVKLHNTGKPCPDCRLKPWDDIVVANFAICLPAWTCHYIEDVQVPEIIPTLDFCRKLSLSWFSLRQAVEQSFDRKYQSKQTGMYHPEIFKGYCQPGGKMGGYYVPMKRVKVNTDSSTPQGTMEM